MAAAETTMEARLAVITASIKESRTLLASCTRRLGITEQEGLVATTPSFATTTTPLFVLDQVREQLESKSSSPSLTSTHLVAADGALQPDAVLDPVTPTRYSTKCPGRFTDNGHAELVFPASASTPTTELADQMLTEVGGLSVFKDPDLDSQLELDETIDTTNEFISKVSGVVASEEGKLQHILSKEMGNYLSQFTLLLPQGWQDVQMALKSASSKPIELIFSQQFDSNSTTLIFPWDPGNWLCFADLSCWSAHFSISWCDVWTWCLWRIVCIQQQVLYWNSYNLCPTTLYPRTLFRLVLGDILPFRKCSMEVNSACGYIILPFSKRLPMSATPILAMESADKYYSQIQSNDAAQLKCCMLHHIRELTMSTFTGFPLALHSGTIARMVRALLYATVDGCAVFKIVDGLIMYWPLHTPFPDPSLIMWRSAASEIWYLPFLYPSNLVDVIQVREVEIDMYIVEEEHVSNVLFQQLNKSTMRNQNNYGQDYQFLNQMVILGGIKVGQDLHFIHVSRHLLDTTWLWDPGTPRHNSKSHSGSRRMLFRGERMYCGFFSRRQVACKLQFKQWDPGVPWVLDAAFNMMITRAMEATCQTLLRQGSWCNIWSYHLRPPDHAIAWGQAMFFGGGIVTPGTIGEVGLVVVGWATYGLGLRPMPVTTKQEAAADRGGEQK